jgi:hypothetical protein
MFNVVAVASISILIPEPILIVMDRRRRQVNSIVNVQ